MYPKFNWWIGVVEDRVDPKQLGRCKVRIIGYHSEDVNLLPKKDLPWAVPMMPVTSPSISGVGNTPAFLQGSTVLGFFSDGDDEQTPVIIGTLPGKPRNKLTDPTIGFSDPDNKYPLSHDDEDASIYFNDLQESDISRLARNGDAENHASLVNKRETRQEAVPRASAPHIDSIQADKAGAAYDREIWEEPHPRFGGADWVYSARNEKPDSFFEDGSKISAYPFNKVVETEAGHVFEVDDTPNNERIHEYHNSGSFYEVQADGSKITKVIGDEYEITLKDKKVFVKGSCDVTIGGDARLLVTGDMYQEVGGNLFTTVGGDRITKIVGNDMTEVLSGQSTNVSRDHSLRVGGNQTDTIIKDKTQSAGGSMFTTVGGNISTVSVGSTSHTSILGYKVMSATGNVKLLAPVGTMKAVSLNMSLKASLNQTITGTVQLVEAKSLQTVSSIGAQILQSAAQNIIAPARSIIGNTIHTGNYTVVGVASGTIVKQGAIVLGLHKHPSIGAPPIP